MINGTLPFDDLASRGIAQDPPVYAQSRHDKAEVRRLLREFADGVASGLWNQRGYTLNEWKRAGHDPATWRET